MLFYNFPKGFPGPLLCFRKRFSAFESDFCGSGAPDIIPARILFIYFRYQQTFPLAHAHFLQPVCGIHGNPSVAPDNLRGFHRPLQRTGVNSVQCYILQTVFCKTGLLPSCIIQGNVRKALKPVQHIPLCFPVTNQYDCCLHTIILFSRNAA